MVAILLLTTIKMTAHLLRIRTEIFNATNPIIGSFKVLSGAVQVGMELKTPEGKIVGTVGKILAGSIMMGHSYVQQAAVGDQVGLLIFSNVVLSDKETHLIA